MRKSGVKGLGRLLSVLMVAALLMTTAMGGRRRVRHLDGFAGTAADDAGVPRA